MRRESSETVLCRWKKADLLDSFAMSADMDHVAFVRRLGYLRPPRQMLVADGCFSPIYDTVARDGIAWHPNGQEVAYVFLDKERYRLAV